MAKKNKIMKSYRLSPDVIQKIEYLAEEMNLNSTDIIEIAIKQYSYQMMKQYKAENTLTIPK